MYSPIRIFWLKEKSAPQRRDCEIVILQKDKDVASFVGQHVEKESVKNVVIHKMHVLHFVAQKLR